MKPCENIEYMNDEDRSGFACNTSWDGACCPNSADYGKKNLNASGYIDVRCEDCARHLGWLE